MRVQLNTAPCPPFGVPAPAGDFLFFFFRLILALYSKRFTILFCVWDINKLHGGIVIFFDNLFDFFEINTVKFLARVDLVYLVGTEGLVKNGFKCRSIIGENQSMNIKFKRHRCTA